MPFWQFFKSYLPRFSDPAPPLLNWFIDGFHIILYSNLLLKCNDRSLMTSDVFWPFLTYLLHTYFVLPYIFRFGGLSWTPLPCLYPLPTLKSDVINGHSQMKIPFHFDCQKNELKTCRDKVVWFLVRHIGCGWASKSCLSLKLHQFSALCTKLYIPSTLNTDSLLWRI